MIDLRLGPSCSARSNLVIGCHHARSPEPGGAAGAARQQGRGEAQAGLTQPEAISSPVAPVLSFLTGLECRLDLRGFSVPARVQRPLVMG